MKYLLLLLLILAAVSCKEEEIPSFDDLTAGEQAALRARASQRCFSDSLKAFTGFKTDSNQKLTDYDRGDSWQINYKSGTTTSSTKVYVWDRTATAIYFLYVYKTDLDDSYDFIKMTTTVNGQMIDDLRTKKCDQTEKIRTISSPSSTITIKFSKVKTTVDDIDYETDTTYTGNEDLPIFFTNYAKKVVKRKYKDSGSLDSTETAEYTMAGLVDRKSDLKDAYTEYPSGSTRFCIVNYNVGTPNTFNFPYAPLNCKSAAGTNVNTGGDAAFDFTPSTDLRSF